MAPKKTDKRSPRVRDRAIERGLSTSSASGNDPRLQGAKARAHRDNHYLPLRKGAPTHAEIAATEQALQVLFRSLQASACETQLFRAGLTALPCGLMVEAGFQVDVKLAHATPPCAIQFRWKAVQDSHAHSCPLSEQRLPGFPTKPSGFSGLAGTNTWAWLGFSEPQRPGR